MLGELDARAQWVVFRFEDDRKPPYQSRYPDRNASATNRRTWSTLEDSLDAVANGKADGVGYALTEDDRLVFIDLDKCRDPTTGAIDPWALEIVNRFEGCYVEQSVSGTGLHILCRGMLPSGGRRSGKIEIYWRDRFMYTTGKYLPGRGEISDAPDGALRWLWYEKLGANGSNEPVTPINVQVDASIGAIAKLMAKLAAAQENDAEFRYSWNLARSWLKADGTPDWSSYDMSIAARLVRMGFADEEIGLAITLFRAEKCKTIEDAEKPQRHRSYLGITLAKARSGLTPSGEVEVPREVATMRRNLDRAAEVNAKATKALRQSIEEVAEHHREKVAARVMRDEASSSNREDALAWISETIGVGLDLSDIVRYGSDPGHLEMTFSGHDPVNFGPMGNMLSLAKVKTTLYHATGKAIRVTKRLQEDWPMVAELVAKHAARADAGDAEASKRLDDLIISQVEASGAPMVQGDGLYIARRERRTHIYDGHIYVFARTLLRDIRYLGLDMATLWHLLRCLGYTSVTVSTKKSSRSAWCAPTGLKGPRGKIDREDDDGADRISG